MFYFGVEELKHVNSEPYYKVSHSTKENHVFGANDTKNVSALRQRIFPRLSKKDALTLAKEFLIQYKKAQEEYSRLLDAAAQETWGRNFQFHDYRISGIGSDEFSEEKKDEIRKVLDISNKAIHLSYLWQKYAGMHYYVKSLELLEEKITRQERKKNESKS